MKKFAPFLIPILLFSACSKPEVTVDSFEPSPMKMDQGEMQMMDLDDLVTGLEGNMNEETMAEMMPEMMEEMEAETVEEMMDVLGEIAMMENLVDPEDLIGGGPPMDGIPSLDDPKFVSMQAADEWIEDNELVLAINYKGEERVYPLQIMVWHEIVNEVIAGDPILITYCPLCGSGIAFERTIDGEAVEFGTSGKLYNSNLVMYDRKTESYWTQIGGQAIIGELVGKTLAQLDLDTVVWRDYKPHHPNAKVLSQETGYIRAYGRDPYGSYYENSFVWFPLENEDGRIHPKDSVFGIKVNEEYKAYREQDILEVVIEDTVGGEQILIEKNEDGTVSITKKASGEAIPKDRDFWFAWYAFHPETKLWGF